MFSRKTESLVVLTCLFVISVQTWFLVRRIAMTPESQPAPVTIVDQSPLRVAAAAPEVTPDETTPATEDETSTASPGTEPQSIVERLRAHEGARSYAEPREVSAMNSFLWGAFPYLCILSFFVVPVIRMIYRPFSWSTRASSLFSRQMLGAASLLLHWGLVLLLLGHLSGLIGGVLGSSLAISFFYWSGLLGGFMVLAGSLVGLYRRFSDPSVRAMSQPEDYIVHLFIASIVGIALYQVVVHRIFGISYGASTWAASLWTLSPQPELMASASLLTKLHILLALTFFAYFPFTKLVHFWTFPINYFVRPRISMRTQRYCFQRRWEFAWRSDKSWLTYGLGAVAVIFLFSGMLLGRATPANGLGLTLASTEATETNEPWLMGYPLYVSQCARCHGLDGRGNGIGANSPTFSAPPRDLVAARYHFVSTDNGVASDDDLYRTIYRGLNNTGMPAFSDITNEQIVSLIDVLNDFRAGGSEPGQTYYVGTPPAPTPQSIARGRELWDVSCANCHGASGRGDGGTDSFDYLSELVLPADLAAGNIKAGADAKQVYLRIVAGIPGGFGGSNIMLKFDRIPVEDRWALVHYMMEEIMPEQE